jgi:DNA-binding NarL/FixJ family response regulator
MTTKYKTTIEHLDFCNTEYQRQIIEMILDGMTQAEIAKELGKDPRRTPEDRRINCSICGWV